MCIRMSWPLVSIIRTNSLKTTTFSLSNSPNSHIHFLRISFTNSKIQKKASSIQKQTINWKYPLNKMTNQETNNQKHSIQFDRVEQSMDPMKWKCLPRIYYVRSIYSEAIAEWNGNAKLVYLLAQSNPH